MGVYIMDAKEAGIQRGYVELGYAIIASHRERAITLYGRCLRDQAFRGCSEGSDRCRDCSVFAKLRGEMRKLERIHGVLPISPKEAMAEWKAQARKSQ